MIIGICPEFKYRLGLLMMFIQCLMVAVVWALSSSKGKRLVLTLVDFAFVHEELWESLVYIPRVGEVRFIGQRKLRL